MTFRPVYLYFGLLDVGSHPEREIQWVKQQKKVSAIKNDTKTLPDVKKQS